VSAYYGYLLWSQTSFWCWKFAIIGERLEPAKHGQSPVLGLTFNPCEWEGTIIQLSRPDPSLQMLAWMVNEKKIEPHVPVWGKPSRKDGTFGYSRFEFDAKRNRYTCPMGKHLHTTGRPTSDNIILYRSKNLECQDCPVKSQCCPKTPQRKISRSIHEPARDVARAIAKTDAYKQSRKDRKKVEMLFAHLKRILNLDRLRLRGLSGAQDEFLLAATAQNLRRMAKWCAPIPTKRVVTYA